MGTWELQEWQRTDDAALPRRERRTGEYWSYSPDPLQTLPLHVDPETSRLLARAETAVLRLAARERADLVSISRYLLRSEAIASSRIEGIAPSPQRIALAELGQHETVTGLSDPAVLVANNMTIVREATGRLADADALTVADLTDLQAALLPETPRLHGIRDRQNWVGGSQWHPLDAEFVPPHPQHVHALLDDLIDYCNGAAHAPLVQAALAHAQFETIHPFADGNGRVGRALIHAVLARRGLTAGAVLPVSLVLATHSDEYIRGLSGFRSTSSNVSDPLSMPGEGNAGSHAEGVLVWLQMFAAAVLEAAARAGELADELAQMRIGWDAQLDDWRASSGMTRALRSDSAVHAILRDLPGTPVLTAAAVRRIHGTSEAAALKALETLREAEILSTISIGRGKRAYLSGDVLNLITVTERQLASTRFDTRLSPPIRPVPAAPPDARRA
ncbi:Fic family protein [Brevibacterium album]|uniref:Fic family protein n=1 Tax=Brevibacterium album TaxID=417948 RepID=UPI00041C0E59|nr:Fic family protein [Brevibacterium album]